MKNVAFHSLLRWNTIILPILTTSLIHFSIKVRENVLLNLGVKGLILVSPTRVPSSTSTVFWDGFSAARKKKHQAINEGTRNGTQDIKQSMKEQGMAHKTSRKRWRIKEWHTRHQASGEGSRNGTQDIKQAVKDQGMAHKTSSNQWRNKEWHTRHQESGEGSRNGTQDIKQAVKDQGMAHKTSSKRWRIKEWHTRHQAINEGTRNGTQDIKKAVKDQGMAHKTSSKRWRIKEWHTRHQASGEGSRNGTQDIKQAVKDQGMARKIYIHCSITRETWWTQLIQDEWSDSNTNLRARSSDACMANMKSPLTQGPGSACCTCHVSVSVSSSGMGTVRAENRRFSPSFPKVCVGGGWASLPPRNLSDTYDPPRRGRRYASDKTSRPEPSGTPCGLLSVSTCTALSSCATWTTPGGRTARMRTGPAFLSLWSYGMWHPLLEGGEIT